MNEDDIRDFVKNTRIRKGYSRRELSTLTGIAENTIARFEGGKTRCSIELVLNMVDKLDAQFKIDYK